ncbi:MAG TPA: multiprotein-bridging factor 1 family protein [Thermoplasmata archaeon]|nr:multiprotein-bridging factor 1 family protein [Thermoplasmata archaeon]
MICEMCGNDVDTLTPVRVEGSVLQLCAGCGKFGQAVAPPVGPTTSSRRNDPEFAEPRGPRAFRPRRTEERDVFSDMPEMELAPDWFHRIRHQRELLGWSPEEFGKRLNEKKSLVLKVESGNFRPPDATLRKIERLLKLRLTLDPNAPAT